MQVSHSPQQFIACERSSGQRLDNFLLRELKGVPRTCLYRLIRKGAVRVNGKRVKKAMLRLALADKISVPEIVQNAAVAARPPSQALQDKIKAAIIFEDDDLLVLNKPAHLAVHAGSGEKLGIIEIIRTFSKAYEKADLVHRLDKPTSGCLLIAKNRETLLKCHEQLTQGCMKKQYHLLVKGHWQQSPQKIMLPLEKTHPGKTHRVRVCAHGKNAQTTFKTLKYLNDVTLLQATLETGRTHQIRVHAQSVGHPIIGDDKYGDRVFNKKMAKLGYDGLCLHAQSISLNHHGKPLTLQAKPPAKLAAFIHHLM